MTAYRVEVRVMPRASLLDPQGQAVSHALHALGFAEVGDVRVGKPVLAPKRLSHPAAIGSPDRQIDEDRARELCL